MRIRNHLLKGKITVMESPNQGAKLDLLDTIIIHYTAGGDAPSAAQWLCNPQAQASAHLVVGQGGKIYQLVPFDTVAWHAGKSSYILPDGSKRKGYNNYSIGIELDNAGALEESDSGYRSWFGRIYPEEELFHGTHRHESTPRYWHRYTEEQIILAEEICRLLVGEYGIKYILGHEEIAPKRKQDPGPAFPLDKMRERIFYLRRYADPEEATDLPLSGVVIAAELNIRSGPGATEQTVAEPLGKGAKVKIYQESNGWYRVGTEIEGWVSKKHIKVDRP